MQKLHNYLVEQNLPYFWHPKYNLFDKISSKELENHANRLKNILNVIDKKIESDPFILADIVCECLIFFIIFFILFV